VKRIFAVLAALCLLVATQSFAATANFTLPTAATTSAGIYDSNGVLIRSLWSNVHYNAGTYTANWNGLDDSGVLRPNGSYTLRVLSNNVQYTWEGVIGNTSDNSTGDTVHHGLDTYLGMAVNGTTIYLTSGYNEWPPSAFKTTTTNPQQRTKKLFRGYTNVYHVVTDGTNVYWSARDPATSENSFVLVTKASDDTDATLSSGTPVNMTYVGTYNNAMDYISGTGAGITGLAVQKTGPYLFVAHRALNRLDVLNKTTGALVQTLTFTAPGALAVDASDNLWMVRNTTLLTKYSVAANGTLTSLGGVTSGLVKPLALAVSPTGAQILVADGGTSQQVKGFSTTSYALVGTLGQAGGYANGPTVTNDKFFFRNLSQITLGGDSFSPDGDWAYLAFQPDGKLWVGDPGNGRVLRFAANGPFIDRIQFARGFYNARVDVNNTTRVFADFLEYSVDYSKGLAPNNGSWTLVRNWGWGVTSNYLAGLNGLRNITTLAPSGRTYALIGNQAANKLEVVELPSSGNLRFTGVLTDSGLESLDKDGALRTFSHLCDWPSYNPAGTQISWKKRAFTGLDSSNNPTWASSWTTVATSPVLSANEVCNTFENPWEFTSSGIALTFQDNNSPLADWHIQGLDTSTGQWKWRAAPATHADYWGPYPTDGHFDVGNNLFSPYAGGSYHASGSNIFWHYRGEGWKNGQTNEWVHLNDDGLVVGQFGEAARDGASPGLWLPEAAAKMSGNAFRNAVVAAADGSRYIYQNDESWHGGVHRWHISSLDSIHEDSISITLANTYPQSGLQAQYYDDTSLSNVKALEARVEPEINASFGENEIPLQTGLTHANDYSIRWRGFVQPAYSENYTFYVLADDGVRLWVNNVLLIDNWQNQTSAVESSGTIKLEANKLYQVKMEFYHHTGESTTVFSWSSASQAKEMVPTGRMFYTDTSPTFTGLNLHDGLWFAAPVEDGIYGWHRSPAQDVTADQVYNWWKVNTGRYSYRKERPVDIHINHSGGPGAAHSSTATLTRDLRPVSASAVSTWTLSGKLAYGSTANRSEYGSYSVGHYLEVLDDAGKIIARLYPQEASSNQVAIRANSSSTTVKLWTRDTFMKTIQETPTQFSISAASGQVTFTFADGTSGPVALFDSTANWQKPTTLRLFFFDSGYSYGKDISLADATFVTTP